MTTNEITTSLKFANLQIAAEALYAFDPRQGPLVPGNTYVGPARGNFPSDGNEPGEQVPHRPRGRLRRHLASHRTQKQHHLRLQRHAVPRPADRPDLGIVAGELVLSFRSTEFADDAVRDNQATNVMEIKEHGWAFGQIADMEARYATCASCGLIPTGPCPSPATAWAAISPRPSTSCAATRRV